MSRRHVQPAFIHQLKPFIMTNQRHSCIAVIAAIAVMASCTRDYQTTPEMNHSPDSRRSETEIPVGEAVAALNRFLDSSDPVTRGVRRTIARIDRVSASDMFPAATRSENDVDAGDLLYVVNFSGDEGYAILGADSRLDTVLIVGDNGNFDPLLLGTWQSEPIQLNPGQDSIPNPGRDPNFQIMPGLTADDLYCEEEDEYYIGAIGNVCPVDNLIVDLLIDYTQRHTIWAAGKEVYEGSHGGGNLNVEPLLKTKWGQGYPYNNAIHYSPTDDDTDHGKRRSVGCTTIAAAQILVYLKNVNLPDTFGITNSTWATMENFTRDINDKESKQLYIDSTYNNTKNDIASLIKQSADGIGVHYNFLGKGGTFALPVQVQRYLQGLGYNVQRKIGFNRKRQDQIVASLRDSRPVFIGALDKKACKEGGHAWVIDGCKYHDESKNYFNHCNFGWNGNNNGWYYYKLFDSSDIGVEIDEGETSSNTFNYTWWFRILLID